MRVIALSNEFDFKKEFAKIGSSIAGVKIMEQKSKLYFFYIKDLKTPAANILKQDSLSIGADLVVPKDTICCKDEFVDTILIATKRELEILIKKQKLQPFGLKELSSNLKDLIDQKRYRPKIMGIINANSDSFYQNSRFMNKEALTKIEQMIQDKADIIDIGAVSSRPGSIGVSQKEELERLKPIIDSIYKQKLHDKVIFSLDSYQVKPIEYALEHGFKMINDITGLKDDKVCSLVASYGASAVIMHMQKNPKDMQKNPTYENIILDIEDFFQQRISKAKDFGIKDIILDVGIGFGKSLEHNLILLKHLRHFKKFGYELLVGASRKSMIDMISKSLVDDRLAGSLILHLNAIKEGASIIRVHDIKEHIQAIKVQQALDEVLL